MNAPGMDKVREALAEPLSNGRLYINAHEGTELPEYFVELHPDDRLSGRWTIYELVPQKELAAAREALSVQQAEPLAAFSEAVVLPDGSSFAVASFPLPKDHWLYAPRGGWDSERDEYAECPRPILNNAQRDAVRAAIRYAVRGATMCGQETDFDPDAMVQNACYALCGPATGSVLPADAQPAPSEPAVPALPHPGSPEASAMLDSLLSEYGWPANPKNAARAGYEAARRLMAAPQPPAKGSES